MSYDPDALLDRRRLKRRLRIWQGVTTLAVVFGVLAVLRSQGDLFRGDYVARIYVDDIILRDDARSQLLEALASDDSVRGVIVHIDSPGGSFVGGEDLYKNLSEIAENKPVAAVMSTVATSAAYMASIAACRLLVDGDDGAINQGVFQIGITTYGFEKTLENSTISPATKSAELAVPVPKIHRQVAPW